MYFRSLRISTFSFFLFSFSSFCSLSCDTVSASFTSFHVPSTHVFTHSSFNLFPFVFVCVVLLCRITSFLLFFWRLSFTFISFLNNLVNRMAAYLYKYIYIYIYVSEMRCFFSSSATNCHTPIFSTCPPPLKQS